MADQQLKIRIDAIDNATKALTDVKNQLKGLSNTTDNLSTSFFTLKNTVLAFATGATITAVVNQTRKFQDLQTILSRVTGSAENGTQVLNFLIDSTRRSTFSVQDLANSFITLSTAGINPTERLLKVFTDTASASTDQLDTLNDLTRLFAKGVQGGLGLQALNQLVAKGIPAFKILENELGLTKDGIEKFAQTTRGANKILEALLNGLEKSFSGATEARANNISVALSRISKESDLVLQKIGDQGLTKSVNDLAESFSSLTKEGDALLEFLGKLTSATVDSGTGFIKFARDVANALKFTIKQEIDDVNRAFDLLLGRTKNAKVQINGTFTSPTEITGRSTGLPKTTVTPEPLLDFQSVIKRVIEDNQNKLDRINDAFFTTQGLTKTITDTLNAGISQFSEKIAESIVLGKQLSDVFRNIGQSLLISILKTSIEILGREILNLFYAKLQTFEIVQQIGKLLEKLAVERAITREKEAQARANSSGGGSIEQQIFSAIVGSFFAEGGNIQAGQPAVVGERGRELFIPSTSGTIVPNHDMGVGGMNITFNIQANDVRGIKELLIDNRATIINLVNQGANQKGKSNVV
jgi:hypothetical protein